MTTTNKPPLLLLVHRIPFPPNKGDKIRSWHLLLHLLKSYQVHIGYFVDDLADVDCIETVNALCASACSVVLNPYRSRLASLAGLLTHRALTLDYYHNAQMGRWVDATIKQHGIGQMVIFSSAMAQYAEAHQAVVRIIDFVDIDSDKWLQYAVKKWWPLSWLYHREGVKLLQYERHIAALFDHALFVSPQESALFRTLAPESAHKISFFSNGVDTEYFSPHLALPSPYLPSQKIIVFTGAMDYWPNCDAVDWFAREMLPLIRERFPETCFYIVGSRPTQQVMALAMLQGVTVTGTVADVRPYLVHADVAVAPLRIARGIQNKVLEAMSAGKTVIVSPEALEGIDAKPVQEVLLAETAQQFVTHICRIFTGGQVNLGRAARSKMVTQYGWDANLAVLDRILSTKESSNLKTG